MTGSAILYLRVSTAQQADDGYGLEAQEHACREFLAHTPRALRAIYVDAGVSAAAPLSKRPGLMSALADLQRDDWLVVAKRDRLSRDWIEGAMIERAVLRAGAQVVSAAGEGTGADDPANVLQRRMIDAFAEYERLMIRQRTRVALAVKRRRGERVGHIPYGSQLAADGIHLEPCTVEKAVLHTIRELKRKGLSTRAITAQLNSLDIHNRQGRPWNHVLVWRVSRDLVDRLQEDENA